MGVGAQLEKLVVLFAELPQVGAVALEGSKAGRQADSMSDFDLYICTNEVVPLETRREFVRQLGGASVDNLGHDYFGGGHEWVDARTGAHFDLMYFGLGWLRSQVERPLGYHQPSLGYSTAFAFTVNRAEVPYDPDGTFAALQAVTREPYPESLREAVVNYNYPLLRNVISSYAAQLEKAASRRDMVSLNHRLAALLASYFDVVFAVNRLLHPGEKRLLQTALETCESLPENFERDVTETLKAAGDGAQLLTNLTRLLGALDAWLRREGFDVTGSRPARISAG